MLFRILLIDDSAEYRKLLINLINTIRQDVQVVEYDPASQKLPGENFPWDNYALIILDYDLGLGKENGLGWMMHFSTINRIPPVIMLTAAGNPELAVNVLKAGAIDFIDKEDINDDVLRTTLDDFLNSTEHTEKKTEQPLPELLFQEENEHVMTSAEKTVFLLNDTDEHRFGVSVPGYNIIREIGRGGMSTVLLATPDDDEGLEVVLKVMFTGNSLDETSLKRFMQEYKLISALDHPNVVNIFERAFASDFAYIAMEHFPGGDLSKKMTEGLNIELAVDYIRQICSGLVAIHELDIVHRDMKPGNILFRSDGTLTITDFGAAKNQTGETEDITINNAIVGTPYYMSPEQGTGMKLDHRSDLYSLGVMIFQMLTNEKPFRATSIPHLISMHVHAPIPRLPAEFSSYQPLIDGLLAKDPDDRFQSANDVLLGLDWIA